MLVAVALPALAQDPPRYYFQDNTVKPQDLLKKKSTYSDKAFNSKSFGAKSATTKTFETKPFTAKEFSTKAAPDKEFTTSSSSMAGKNYATKSFESPKPKSWWQRLFGTKTAAESGKTYETTRLPTKIEAKLQEKIDKLKQPGRFKAPTIAPTPENINKPVGR